MNDDNERAESASGGEDPARLRLVRAAAQVFAEKGYARATTRAIAAAAGVNEVTLFRQFGTKQNLFMAVIEQFSPLAGIASLVNQEPGGSYRDDLLRLARLFDGVLAQHRESVLLMLCESQHLPELRAVASQLPYRLRQTFAAYLRRQIARGVVRDLDPDVMAQAFAGMVFANQIGQAILLPGMRLEASDEAVLEQFVDLFVAGTTR